MSDIATDRKQLASFRSTSLAEPSRRVARILGPIRSYARPSVVLTPLHATCNDRQDAVAVARWILLAVVLRDAETGTATDATLTSRHSIIFAQLNAT